MLFFKMLYRLIIPILLIFVASCSSPDRPDIKYDDFEKANFDKWDKLGKAFDSPVHVDSISERIENVQGKFVAFSNYNSQIPYEDQGKLVSKRFIINRKYINLLLAGSKHDTRICINLIVNNRIVKTATGENDYFLRSVFWDVTALEGEEAIIEIVDAMSQVDYPLTYGNLIVDHVVFTDAKHANEIVFEDFESGTYNNWKITGEAFVSPLNRTSVFYPLSTIGFEGNFFASSYTKTHDTKKGKLSSNQFIITHDYIKFLVGGGGHEGKTCINLVVNGEVIFSSVGDYDGQMRLNHWDVRPYKGQAAIIEIVDDYSQDWGHIMVDEIVFYNDGSFYKTAGFWSIITLVFIFSLGLIIRKKRKPKIEVGIEKIEELNNLKQRIQGSGIYKQANITVTDIARDGGYTEKEINFLFEKAGNTSLLNYLNYLRVEEFKKQLKDPKNKAYTMVSISENCGFSSKTSFYRIFKSITKMTPSEYKKRI